MIDTPWSILTLVSRLAVYLGTAGGIGALFASLLFSRATATSFRTYLIASCWLGLLGAIAYFLVRTAALAESWSAVTDSLFLSIALGSAFGHSSLAWAGGFGLALLASLLLRRSRGVTRRAALLALLAGMLLVLAGYPLAGHLAEADPVSRIALSLHVLAMSLWLGSLYPLLRLLSSERAAHSMVLFGKVGEAIVALLLLCGLWLAWLLIDSPAMLLQSGYGRLLLIKLAAVSLLLLLAASNKWWWVPRLHRHDAQGPLGRSIRAEIGLGLCILLLTAVLANLFSPGH